MAALRVTATSLCLTNTKGRKERTGSSSNLESRTHLPNQSQPEIQCNMKSEATRYARPVNVCTCYYTSRAGTWLGTDTVTFKYRIVERSLNQRRRR